MKQFIYLLSVLLAFGVTACKNSKKTTAAAQAAEQSETAKATAESSIETAAVSEEEDAVLTEEEEMARAQDPMQYAPQMSEDSYFKMIRTPCFGRCPVYNFEVKQNGFALLEGIQFFEYMGMHEAQFSETQLNKIKALAEEYGYLEMEHVYDAPVTDLPSTTTALRTRDGIHWVYNRMNAPQALNDFQTEVETLIKDVQWKPADQTTD
jgi:hypothetical protein